MEKSNIRRTVCNMSDPGPTPRSAGLHFKASLHTIHTTLIWSKASGMSKPPVFCGRNGSFHGGRLKAKPDGHKGRGSPLFKKDEIRSFIP